MLPPLKPLTLSEEQEFELSKTRLLTEYMTTEELREILVDLKEANMLHQNVIRNLLMNFG